MFLVTLKNTFFIAFASIVVGFPVPIILAMVINQLRNKKWKRVVQTTVYIPYFISVVVMVSILRIMLADGTGVIDGFLKGIHLVNENIKFNGVRKSLYASICAVWCMADHGMEQYYFHCSFVICGYAVV